MNARSIKRIIQRRPARGYILLSLPFSVAPPQPQPVEFDGLNCYDRVNGFWVSGDNKTLIYINKVYGPNPNASSLDPWERPVCVTRKRNGWEWWEGCKVVEVPGMCIREPIDDELVEAHRAWSIWWWSLFREGHGPVMDAVVDVCDRSGVMPWFHTDGPTLDVDLRFKRHYYDYLDKHVALIARVVRVANAHGVRVTLHK